MVDLPSGGARMSAREMDEMARLIREQERAERYEPIA